MTETEYLFEQERYDAPPPTCNRCGSRLEEYDAGNWDCPNCNPTPGWLREWLDYSELHDCTTTHRQADPRPKGRVPATADRLEGK